MKNTAKTLTLFAPLLSFGGLACAEESKLAYELQNTSGSANVRVIVQYKPYSRFGRFERMRSRGGMFTRKWSAVQSGAAYSVPASALKDLDNDAGIAHVSVDHPIHGRLD